MPEFNNISYELTDAEKFALICGMLAGLRLQDKTQPPDQVTVTLDPIGVNGLGTIGLMAEDIQYEGINNISIPVITHDVDTEYSGFSLSVSYDSSRVKINSIKDGDFGVLQGTSIQTGKAYTRCMLDKGKFMKDPCIVCWLNCTILDPPTKNNPIEIKFENSTGYDPKYCSLLTWILNETDNNYYSYFITPTVNRGCYILSDTPEDNKSNLGDEVQSSALASPSMIAMGTTVIYPGKQGLVPIYTNCNKKDNFIYNKFELKAVIPQQWLSILEEIGIISTDEWTITYTREYDKEGNLVLNISGERDAALADNSTVGFIRFLLSETADSIDCTVGNISSVLLGPLGSLEVIKGDGYLGYPPPKEGSEAFDWGDKGGTSYWGSGAGAGGSSGGGTYGSGVIWSGSSQDIWISMGGGNKYPVHLEPGNNDVNFWIPALYPEDMWIEETPTIESKGYILIPGGFEFETVIKPGAPLGLSSPRVTDRFEIKDINDVLKETIEPPVNLDDILDTFEIVDMSKQELLNKVISEKGFSSNFELKDFIDTDLEHAPAVFEKAFSDNLEMIDITLTNTVSVNIKDQPESEVGEITDVMNIFIPRMLRVSGTVNNAAFGSIGGLGLYEEDTTALLKAIANSGYKADKWYIAGVQVGEGNSLSVLVDDNIEVYLEFIETLLNDFDLAINKEGSKLEFINTSSIPWIINTNEYGGVKSGHISDIESTEISTTIPYSGVFSYDYKVSSESNYDKLNIYKNDVLLSSYSGTNTENDKLIGVTAGDIIKFTYSKDSSGASGDDACYVKNVCMLDNSKFNKAINKEGSNLEFENISNAPWFINNDVFGGVRSGNIRDSESTSISTKITKAGTFYFDYKVSSESGYDKLIVYKNDEQMYQYSGVDSNSNINFTVVENDIVRFTYSKDGSGASGNDACYIKNVYLQ